MPRGTRRSGRERPSTCTSATTSGLKKSDAILLFVRGRAPEGRKRVARKDFLPKASPTFQGEDSPRNLTCHRKLGRVFSWRKFFISARTPCRGPAFSVQFSSLRRLRPSLECLYVYHTLRRRM